VCCLGVVHAPVQSTCHTLPPFCVHRSSHRCRRHLISEFGYLMSHLASVMPTSLSIIGLFRSGSYQVPLDQIDVFGHFLGWIFTAHHGPDGKICHSNGFQRKFAHLFSQVFPLKIWLLMESPWNGSYLQYHMHTGSTDGYNIFDVFCSLFHSIVLEIPHLWMFWRTVNTNLKQVLSTLLYLYL